MQNKVQRVIVVFKTHLDIGFTGLAKDILRRYCEEFIPAAVALSFRVNTPAHKKFVWTTGSYLIRHYLEQAQEPERSLLCQAIRLGYIRWHGLACTTHTELMNRRILEYDLSVSQNLDRQFSLRTIAAKMTDVPGHTISLVPALSDAGIEYLHIGVNDSSRVPSVPPLFIWRFENREVIVNYAGGYGDTTILENGTALEFYHAHDNTSPPSQKELDALYGRLQEKYPGAHIEAGTLDDFARALHTVRHTLPVVEEEIGDTWIHGVSSDPLKVSRYRRLCFLSEKWIADGSLSPGSKAYDVLMENLLLICEHTWGMDTKKFLLDFTNWEKEDFTAARKKDATSYELFSPQNGHLFRALLPELEAYKKERMGSGSSYSLFESSHQEQREYLEKALQSLSAEKKEEAAAFLAFSYPQIPAGAVRCAAGAPLDAGPYTITVGSCGELTAVAERSPGSFRPSVPKACPPKSRQVSIGLLEYETFGGKEADDCYFAYGRDLSQNFYWAEPDFGKPGLRYHPSIGHRLFRPAPADIYLYKDMLYIRLLFPEEACTAYGCPREAMAVYRFAPGSIRLELFWKDKDALRSPEALWLRIAPGGSNPARWTMEKLGASISPQNVVHNGARQLHAIESLSYQAADDRIRVLPLDAPLVSAGGKKLYRPDNCLPDLSEGFHFLLYNNRWGTNFKQWFDEDMRFAFEIRYS